MLPPKNYRWWAAGCSQKQPRADDSENRGQAFAGWGEQLASTEVLHIPLNLYTSPVGDHCPWFSDEGLRLRETKEAQDRLDRNIQVPGLPQALLCVATEWGVGVRMGSS